MPDMYEGLHAKMSTLARRKLTSTNSYFGSRVELTLNALPSGAAGSRGTSFVYSAASKMPACLAEESRSSLTNFSRFATSSSSSASASACSTYSTSQSNACSIHDPMLMTPFDPSIFILR
jgi:hypothetical protein